MPQTLVPIWEPGVGAAALAVPPACWRRKPWRAGSRGSWSPFLGAGCCGGGGGCPLRMGTRPILHPCPPTSHTALPSPACPPRYARGYASVPDHFHKLLPKENEKPCWHDSKDPGGSQWEGNPKSHRDRCGVCLRPIISPKPDFSPGCFFFYNCKHR